eukprot:tig00000403_g263.t1
MEAPGGASAAVEPLDSEPLPPDVQRIPPGQVRELLRVYRWKGPCKACGALSTERIFLRREVVKNSALAESEPVVFAHPLKDFAIERGLDLKPIVSFSGKHPGVACQSCGTALREYVMYDEFREMEAAGSHMQYASKEFDLREPLNAKTLAMLTDRHAKKHSFERARLREIYRVPLPVPIPPSPTLTLPSPPPLDPAPLPRFAGAASRALHAAPVAPASRMPPGSDPLLAPPAPPVTEATIPMAGRKKSREARVNTNCPHKDVKHHAKGMCLSCYRKTREQAVLAAAAAAAGGGGAAVAAVAEAPEDGGVVVRVGYVSVPDFIESGVVAEALAGREGKETDKGAGGCAGGGCSGEESDSESGIARRGLKVFLGRAKQATACGHTWAAPYAKGMCAACFRDAREQRERRAAERLLVKRDGPPASSEAAGADGGEGEGGRGADVVLALAPGLDLSCDAGACAAAAAATRPLASLTADELLGLAGSRLSSASLTGPAAESPPTPTPRPRHRPASEAGSPPSAPRAPSPPPQPGAPEADPVKEHDSPRPRAAVAAQVLAAAAQRYGEAVRRKAAERREAEERRRAEAALLEGVLPQELDPALAHVLAQLDDEVLAYLHVHGIPIDEALLQGLVPLVNAHGAPLSPEQLNRMVADGSKLPPHIALSPAARRGARPRRPRPAPPRPSGRPAAGRGRGRGNTNCPHHWVKHHAKGMCLPCYRAHRQNVAAERAAAMTILSPELPAASHVPPSPMQPLPQRCDSDDAAAEADRPYSPLAGAGHAAAAAPAPAESSYPSFRVPVGDGFLSRTAAPTAASLPPVQIPPPPPPPLRGPAVQSAASSCVGGEGPGPVAGGKRKRLADALSPKQRPSSPSSPPHSPGPGPSPPAPAPASAPPPGGVGSLIVHSGPPPRPAGSGKGRHKVYSSRCPHSHVKHHAKGMCWSCYNRARIAAASAGSELAEEEAGGASAASTPETPAAEAPTPRMDSDPGSPSPPPSPAPAPAAPAPLPAASRGRGGPAGGARLTPAALVAAAAASKSGVGASASASSSGAAPSSGGGSGGERRRGSGASTPVYYFGSASDSDSDSDSSRKRAAKRRRGAPAPAGGAGRAARSAARRAAARRWRRGPGRAGRRGGGQAADLPVAAPALPPAPVASYSTEEEDEGQEEGEIVDAGAAPPPPLGAPPTPPAGPRRATERGGEDEEVDILGDD